jgi:uncharacterized protein (DUF1697 family)
MKTYIALLRAINVGGHACVTMDQLREAFAAAGCRNVRTLIQSGNVIFESAARSPEAIAGRIRPRLRALLGSEPGIVLRTLEEIEELVRQAPFKDADAGKDAKFYVVFMSETPRIASKLPLAVPEEALEVVGMRDREVFVVSRRKADGSSGSPNSFVEKKLGVSATTRNWSTVRKLAAPVLPGPLR